MLPSNKTQFLYKKRETSNIRRLHIDLAGHNDRGQSFLKSVYRQKFHGLQQQQPPSGYRKFSFVGARRAAPEIGLLPDGRARLAAITASRP